MRNPNRKKPPNRARSRAIRARMSTAGEPWTVAARFIDDTEAGSTLSMTRMDMEIDADVRRVRLLDKLYEFQPPHPGMIPDVTDVLDLEQRNASNEEFWREILRALDRDGLIKLYETMGFDGTSMMITHAGRVEVEARKARRRDPARRNMAARNAVVNWLYAQPGHQAPDVTAMTDDPGYLYEAQTFAAVDLNTALAYLVNATLVNGTSASDGLNVQPRLTAKGIDCAEQFGGSVSDYLRRNADGSTQHNVNFNGVVSGNVAWNSEQVTQTATTTGLAADEVQNIVRAVVEALPVLGLSTEDEDQVRSDLDVVEEELTSEQPNSSVIKKVMTKVAAALGTATNSALAPVLTAGVGELMRHAGIPIE